MRDKKAYAVPLHRLPPHDNELLRPLHQKPRELVAQDLLDLVGLLHGDRHSDGVHGRLYQATLLRGSADGYGVEEELLAGAGLDLGLVVPLDCLGGEVADADGSVEGGTDAVQVGAEGVGLGGEGEC